MNSAIVPLVSNYIIPGSNINILINNMLIIFLSNAFASPFVWLANISYFLSLFKRKLIERKYGHEDPIEEYTQKELNQLYENPNMEIFLKYSYISKTILMTLFYLPILPLGAVISIFGIGLAYIVEKFNLLRVYKRPENLNSQICEFYVYNFKIFMFIYAVGNYIFLINVYPNNLWCYVNIILFGVLLIIPYHEALKISCLGDLSEGDILNKPYNGYYFDFPVDYMRANPLTKKSGQITYITRMRDNGIITEEEYQKLTKEMEDNNVNVLEVYYRNNANQEAKVRQQVANLFKDKYKEKKGVNTYFANLISNQEGIENLATKKTAIKNLGTAIETHKKGKVNKLLAKYKKDEKEKEENKNEINLDQNEFPLINIKKTDNNKYIDNDIPLPSEINSEGPIITKKLK